MSYSVIIRVKEGKPVIDGHDALPDGEFVISGGEDERLEHIAVTRRTPDGRYAESASHTRPKEA